MWAAGMSLMDLTPSERKEVRDAMKNGRRVSQPGLRPFVATNATDSIERVKRQLSGLRRSRLLFLWVGAPILTAVGIALLVIGGTAWRIVGALDLLIVVALLSATPLAVSSLERSKQRYEAALRENS
jgi:hypothetical protein